jgi:nitrate reductase beta subunit
LETIILDIISKNIVKEKEMENIMKLKIPIRYLPFRLTKRDKQKQKRMLMKSKKLYKKGQYYTRKKVKSFVSKTSNHIKDARKLYKIESIKPSEELAKVTGCSLDALEKIVETVKDNELAEAYNKVNAYLLENPKE